MHSYIQFVRRADPAGESIAQLTQAQRMPWLTERAEWTIVNTGGSFQSPHLEACSPAPDFEAYVRFESSQAASRAAAAAASYGILAQTFEVDCFETSPAELDDGGAALGPGFVKRVAVVSRRLGLSREAFIDYYESQHAPLAARVMPLIARYRRSFLRTPVGETSQDWPRLAFDAVTELYYRSEADRQSFREALSDPELARVITEDEVNLFDRSAIHGLDVREVELG
ncbi:EthD domain-containing protein [Nocardia rhamnosiphila]|uniref:EthD domain-containing protein n=1 Tax=Nocardia rhamnosiphila TaxID=426716 RepID=A0ABV2WYQ5_9NOCA